MRVGRDGAHRWERRTGRERPSASGGRDRPRSAAQPAAHRGRDQSGSAAQPSAPEARPSGFAAQPFEPEGATERVCGATVRTGGRAASAVRAGVDGPGRSERPNRSLRARRRCASRGRNIPRGRAIADDGRRRANLPISLRRTGLGSLVQPRLRGDRRRRERRGSRPLSCAQGRPSRRHKPGHRREPAERA